jgi:hypothetical protein
MHRTNIYLDDAQRELLDRLAREEGTSRAEVIRRLLNRSLGGDDRDLAADLAAIDDSFGVLADVGDLELERGPDDRAAHLERVRRPGA